jgi:RNA polymerase sigma factor (TIGR02999 family)
MDNTARPSSDITGLLLAWSNGDETALKQLMPLMHRELQQIARRCMARERADHSLQATALVNEAYLRLIDVRRVNWQNRTHFLAVSARLMRRILVESARARGSQKRGARDPKVTLDDALMVSAEPAPELVALDDALQALETFDKRRSRVVELRYFGGLSVGETAAALGVSGDTVMRDWRLAKAWLYQEMTGRPRR